VDCRSAETGERGMSSGGDNDLPQEAKRSVKVSFILTALYTDFKYISIRQ